MQEYTESTGRPLDLDKVLSREDKYTEIKFCQ